MDTSMLLRSLIAGLCFGGWQIIMRKSGLNFVLAAYLLQAGSFTLFTLMLLSPLRTLFFNSHGLLSTNKDVPLYGAMLMTTIGIGYCAGLVNGVGQMTYQNVVASSGVNLALTTLVMVSMQVGITVVAEIIQGATDLSWGKLASGVAIMAGIYGLRRF